MKAWIFALAMSGTLVGAHAFPYNVEKVKENACQVIAPYDRAVKAEDKKRCEAAAEKIAETLRFNYGIGERPEEDGCEMENIEVLFSLYTEKVVELSRNSHGEMKAHLKCVLEGKPSQFYYITYDDKKDVVVDLGGLTY